MKNFGITSCALNSVSEKQIWQDIGGSLVISYVGVGKAAFYRLRLGKEICVDLLPEHWLGVSAIEGVTSETIDHFLADQVIPRAMAHAGLFIVHASGVRIGESAALFIGASGMGKSTLATSFNNAGSPLMGDDAIVLSSEKGKFRAQPVYPSLRLLPDSIKALLPKSVATTAVSHSSTKRRIDLPVSPTSKFGPQSIGAIFKLCEPSSGDGIHCRPLSIADTCMALIENSFLLDPTDMYRVRAKLSAASELARHVPAFGISYPRNYGSLTEVQNLIRAHLS